MNKALLDTFKKLLEAGILSVTGVFSGFFKTVAWYIVQLLTWLIEGIEGVVTKLYDFNSFFSSEEVVNFVNQWKPILTTILAISIAFLGLKIILNRQSNRKELPMNILLSVLVVTGLTTFMIKLNDITKLGVQATGVTIDKSAVSYVKEYTTDMYKLDADNYNNIKYGINDISDSIDQIDITEEVDTDNINKDNRDLYKYKLDKNGEEKKLDKGFLGFGEEGYYRYVVDWIPLIVSLIALAIALICVALKLARLMVELAFNNLFATLLAFGDIEDGRKLKEVIKHILSMFAVIWTTAVMLKLYFLYVSWINSTFNDSSNTILKLILLIGGSLTVIDGPNIVEKVLGVDAGLKSGWGVVMGAAAGAKIAGGLGMTAGKTLGGAALKYGSKAAQGGLNTGAMATGGVAAAMNKGNSDNKNSLNGAFNGKKDIDSNPNSSNGMQKQGQGINANGLGKNGANSPKNAGSVSNGSIPGSNASGNGIGDIPGSDASGNGISDVSDSNPSDGEIGNIPSGSNFGDEVRNIPFSNAAGNTSKERSKPKNNQTPNIQNGNRTTDMTLGSAFKNKIVNNKVVSTAHRRYDIGYNTIEKWKNNRKDRK